MANHIGQTLSSSQSHERLVIDACFAQEVYFLLLSRARSCDHRNWSMIGSQKCHVGAMLSYSSQTLFTISPLKLFLTVRQLKKFMTKIWKYHLSFSIPLKWVNQTKKDISQISTTTVSANSDFNTSVMNRLRIFIKLDL